MFNEIFTISNYPSLQPDGSFTDKLVRILKTYGALFLMMMAIAPLLFLADKLVTDVLHHKSLNLQNRQLFQQMYKRYGQWSTAFFICVVGPVFEELIFRLALSFKKRDAVISLLIAVGYFFGSLYHPHLIIIKLAAEAVIAVAIFMLCRATVPNTQFSLTLQSRRYVIILSICLFGLMHVFNYRPIDISLIWLYPIFVLPQMLMGWAISYIRFKNGFIWGIALHCLINTVSTMLSYHF